MDFVYWWSCNGNGLNLHPAQKAFFVLFPVFPLLLGFGPCPFHWEMVKQSNHTPMSHLLDNVPAQRVFFLLFSLFLVACVLPHIDYFDPILHFTFPPYLLLPSDNPSPPCSTLPLVTPRTGLSLSRRAASWPPWSLSLLLLPDHLIPPPSQYPIIHVPG